MNDIKGVVDMERLSIQLDMAGCPNRCRHCWLGSHKNGNFNPQALQDVTKEFRAWRDENGQGVKRLGVFSWWREPDFRDDYRQLWELEQELSCEGMARRFELLSIWRLARDESYAPWAAALEPKVCQVTFFGMEKITDWGIHRKGAFADSLLATERLIDAGIAPRWQIFLTKKGLGDLDSLTRLIYKMELHKRCEAIGQKFEVFITNFSPEGGGANLHSERLEKADLRAIPQALIDISRDGLTRIGQTEESLMQELIKDHSPPNIELDEPCIAINADYDCYPNIAEPAPWWRLGNLKTDGINAIVAAFINETTTAMQTNRNKAISELASLYGDASSQKLYIKCDLIIRFLHQHGKEWIKCIGSKM